MSDPTFSVRDRNLDTGDITDDDALIFAQRFEQNRYPEPALVPVAGGEPPEPRKQTLFRPVTLPVFDGNAVQIAWPDPQRVNLTVAYLSGTSTDRLFVAPDADMLNGVATPLATQQGPWYVLQPGASTPADFSKYTGALYAKPVTGAGGTYVTVAAVIDPNVEVFPS